MDSDNSVVNVGVKGDGCMWKMGYGINGDRKN